MCPEHRNQTRPAPDHHSYRRKSVQNTSAMILPLLTITTTDPAGKIPVSMAPAPAAVWAGLLLPTVTPASTIKVSFTAQ